MNFLPKQCHTIHSRYRSLCFSPLSKLEECVTLDKSYRPSSEVALAGNRRLQRVHTCTAIEIEVDILNFTEL